MRYIFIVLSLCIYPLMMVGQSSNSLKGNLTTPRGKEIPFANITLHSQGSEEILQGTVSDEWGAFCFQGLVEGYYSIQAFFVGFEPFKLDSVLVISGVNDLKTLQMKRKATRLEEVTVVSEKSAVENHPGKVVYNIGTGTNAGENALDVFKNIPSLGLDMDDNVTMKGTKATILIDGVESDLADMLDQLPSDVIASIEVISNPSAKYDSKNGGGVINIKLKEDRISGYNHKYNVGYGWPERYTLTGGSGINSGKWNVGISASLKGEPKEDDRITDRTIFTDQGNKYLHQEQHKLRDQKTFFMRGNAKYRFSKKSNASFQVLYQHKNAPQTVRYTSSSFNNDSVLYNYTDNLREEENRSDLLEFKVGWNKVFNQLDDHRLMVQTKYSTSNPLLDYVRTTQPLNPDSHVALPNYSQEVRAGDDVNRSGIIKVDYERPLNEQWKLELGAQLNLRHFEQDKRSDKTNYNAPNDIKNENYSEVNFKFDEIKPGVYAVLNGAKGKYNFSLGLRLESNYLNQYLYDLDSTITNTIITYSPSFLIEKKIDKNYTMGLSYTRREKVPNYKQLNPISLSFGGYYRNSGNPNLQSQQTQSLDFHHHLTYKKTTISGSVFVRHISHLIGTYYTFTEEEGHIITNSTVENLGSMMNLGVEIASSLPWGKFVFRPSVISYYKILDGEKLSHSLDKEEMYLMAKLSSSYHVNKKLSFQLSGNYDGADISAQGRRLAYYFINWSTKYKVMNNKGAIQLKVNDVFDSYDYKKVINQRQDQINHQYYNPLAQYVYLAFSYRFSTMKKK
ncbi:TonB-dependent receptor [Saccharicrinis fermentans]|nr:TonB-dependent receptor [Saccharicrinis fermentans]